VQVELLNVPPPLLLKLTLPVGVVWVPKSISLTEAVQVVASPVAITVGVQVTLVAVKRCVAIVAPVVAAGAGPELA